MKALCWCGPGDVRVEEVPDARILDPHDALVRVTSTAICGSDLHLYNGVIPTLKQGDILGHEFMGEVVEVGADVKSLSVGQRVVVPFPIACGRCFFCERKEYALCDNSNPEARMAEAAYGHSGAGIFGYSHMLGGYAGGQAEYVRVPFADVGPLVIPEGLEDDKVLFLTDIFPTGYQAAEQCEIQPGDTIAVWGCGPVGQFAIKSALMLGAGRVYAIDDQPARLALAAQHDNVEPLDFSKADVYERLQDETAGMGPDACIDAVGLEAHGYSVDALHDRIKMGLRLTTDRANVLRQAIRCCRKGGVLSISGVYGGVVDKFPIGAIFGKALRVRCGQTHVHRYLRPLLERIQNNEIDPGFVISHRGKLDDAAEGYQLFQEHPERCTKIVLNP